MQNTCVLFAKGWLDYKKEGFLGNTTRINILRFSKQVLVISSLRRVNTVKSSKRWFMNIGPNNI